MHLEPEEATMNAGGEASYPEQDITDGVMEFFDPVPFEERIEPRD